MAPSPSARCRSTGVCTARHLSQRWQQLAQARAPHITQSPAAEGTDRNVGAEQESKGHGLQGLAGKQIKSSGLEPWGAVEMMKRINPPRWAAGVGAVT